MNRVGLNSQQFYLESVIKALALSLAFHLAVFGGGELGRHFKWRNQAAWSQGSKSGEQKRGVFPPAVRKKSLATAPREVSITFVEIAPNRAAAPPSKPTEPAQTKNAEPTQLEKPAESKQVPLLPIPAKLPPLPATVPAQPIPLSQPVSKTPPNTQDAKPPTVGDASLTDSVPVKSKTTPIVAANSVGASNPASLEKQSPKAASPGLDSTGKPALAPATANLATAPARRPTIEIDLKGAPFRNYDSTLIAAVQKRWYELLEQRKAARDDTGSVVVEFRLKYDGHITDLKIARREVDFVPAWDCQRAVADSAPFAPWPREMHRTIAANYRSVRFTFVY